jgi:uncharacterized protein
MNENILNDLDLKENGSFEIKNEKGYAMLTVYKPGKNGKAITRQEVFQRLKLFGIDSYDRSKVEVIIANADGNSHEIASWKGGEPIDSKLEILISEDRFSATASISASMHGGKNLTHKEILDLLSTNGIKFGIKDEVIKNLLEKETFFEKKIVAEGLRPTHSENSVIKTFFESINKPSLVQDTHGKIDFKDINIIKNTKKDALIAEKTEPKLGNKGKNIFGDSVDPIPPLEAEWKLGENVYLDEEKKKLFSSIAGRPILDRDGIIRVDEVCYLENVDYSTGNVDFPGTIIVEGTVADNFTLKTKGSLIVKKSVGRVFLFAEKDIVLSGGVMGRNGGVIESLKDVYAKFVEQGNIKAGNNIFIEEASMHSDLVAGESIQIKGGRGELIGGESVAGKKISVSKLGAVVETKTNLIVGLPPEILEELQKMKEEISSHEEVLKKVEQSLVKLQDPRKDLDPEEKTMLKRLKEVEKKYLGLKENTKIQYETVVNTYESDEEAYVEIEKSIYPKVTINFGRGKVYLSELKEFNQTCYIANNLEGIPTRTKGIKKSN